MIYQRKWILTGLLVKYEKLWEFDIVCRARLKCSLRKIRSPNAHVYTFLEEEVDRMVAVLSIIISFLAGLTIRIVSHWGNFRGSCLPFFSKVYESFIRPNQLKAGSGVDPTDQLNN